MIDQPINFVLMYDLIPLSVIFNLYHSIKEQHILQQNYFDESNMTILRLIKKSHAMIIHAGVAVT